MERSSFVESDNPVEFLYLDKERISSLIGQLSEKGLMTGLRSVVSKTTNHEGQAGASVPGIAQVGGKRTRTSHESAEEIYDPFWTNAFTFLRDLEANFAVPLEDARQGSLVKFDAYLQFIDMRIMRSLWGPVSEAWHRSLNPTGAHPVGTSRKKRREAVPQMPAEAKLGLEVMKELPHLLHMTFLADCTPPMRLWAAMKPEHLTIASENLAMKYGAVIEGRWTAVGIVDGSLGEPHAAIPVNDLLDAVMTAIANLREIIGRPKDHFGFTPIAIYTPIHGLAESQAELTRISVDEPTPS